MVTTREVFVTTNVKQFMEKLAAFQASLSPTEQAWLEYIVKNGEPDTDEDVRGFLLTTATLSRLSRRGGVN